MSDLDELMATADESKLDMDRFRPSEWVGKLVLFCGITRDSWEDKTTAAVDVVVVLDADDGPKFYEDSVVFGTVAAKQLLNSGKPIFLGVISEGENKKGNPPIIFRTPIMAQTKAAREWWKKGLIAGSPAEGFRYAPDEAPF
jgi:hypothetical protein